MNIEAQIEAIETELAHRIAAQGLVTQRANAAFQRLSTPKQRVAIANDVLAALKAGTIKATTGKYIDDDASKESIREGKTCHVCALGAVFACAVANPATAVEFVDMPHEMHAQLTRYFTKQQLDDIEDAFEFKPVNGIEGKVLKFNRGVRSRRERLERIMRNIVRNNGTFKP